MNNKKTQSQEKIQQYLEYLRRNDEFMALVNEIKKIHQTKKDKPVKFGSIPIEEVFDNYIEQEQKLRTYLSTLGKDEANELIEKIADEYNIDYDTLDDFFLRDSNDSKKLSESPFFDLCTVTDNYDLDLNETYPSIPIFLDTPRRCHIRAYPVSIDLHPFTTKRDLLNFVEKRWDMIEEKLRDYSEEGKAPRIKKRKYSQEIYDYAWENRNRPYKDIATEIEEKFPNLDYVISYNEVQKMIGSETIRRKKTL